MMHFNQFDLNWNPNYIDYEDFASIWRQSHEHNTDADISFNHEINHQMSSMKTIGIDQVIFGIDFLVDVSGEQLWNNHMQ